MRFITVAAALFAAVVAAQNNAISVPQGSSTLTVTAGQPLTLDWTNPSSGTVTIKLQQDPVTPDSGIILASNVPASALTATVQIPAGSDVNSFQYTIQIIDNTDPSNYNFSPNFGIAGATGTARATDSTASVTGSTTNSTRTASSGTSTGTSSGTSTGSSSASAATTGTSTRSSGSASASASTASRTSSASSSSSASASATAAPNGNGAESFKVQGSFLALAVGAVVAVL